jgi:hypothetical protein
MLILRARSANSSVGIFLSNQKYYSAYRIFDPLESQRHEGIEKWLGILQELLIFGVPNA